MVLPGLGFSFVMTNCTSLDKSTTFCHLPFLHPQKKNVGVVADGTYFLRVLGGPPMTELKRNCYIVSPPLACGLLDVEGHPFLSSVSRTGCGSEATVNACPVMQQIDPSPVCLWWVHVLENE